MERPGGVRDWSHASIDQRKKDLEGFDARWKKLDPAQWPIPKQVNYKLIGSALSRVHWELEVNPGWNRDPNFYIEQTLTALAEALTVPGPYNEARSREILTRIENIPAIPSLVRYVASLAVGGISARRPIRGICREPHAR